ncbi:MAG: TolC family protein, partial [Pseudomonadota bacterium]|nr:TolC family protein [Pseudomonadota bacterium]
IGVAEAAWFPDFSISASYGFVGTVLSKFIQASNSFWTVGPAVAETIFDAGAREAAVEQAEATYDQTVANYRQTVLTAFQQVEDNLAAQRILGDQALVQHATVADARKAEQLTLNQYKQGIAPYNNVLTQQLVTLTSEENALAVENSRLVASVALIQALGGGWNVGELNTPPPPDPAKPHSFIDRIF